VFDVLSNFILTCQFVAATQPINSLAFVFDGVNYGASDFAYSAYSLASFHAHLLPNFFRILSS
jgi:hypothetical protein